MAAPLPNFAEATTGMTAFTTEMAKLQNLPQIAESTALQQILSQLERMDVKVS
jgi:hypothetical protein